LKLAALSATARALPAMATTEKMVVRMFGLIEMLWMNVEELIFGSNLGSGGMGSVVKWGWEERKSWREWNAEEVEEDMCS